MILIILKYSQNNSYLYIVILFDRPDIDTWFVRLSSYNCGATALIFL
jgi:hypothetical protein